MSSGNKESSNWLRNMGLGSKILFLPIIVSLFLLVIGLSTYKQLESISSRATYVTSNLAPAAQEATQLLQITLEKQKVVERFLRGGNDSDVGEFDQLGKRVHETVLLAEGHSGQDEYKELVHRVESQSELFAKVFQEQVVAPTRQRAVTIENLFFNTGPAIQKSLNDINAIASLESATDTSAMANEALKRFLTAKIYMNLYLMNNRDDEIARFELEMMGAQDSVAELDLLVPAGSTLANLVNTTQEDLSAYSTDFDTIVTSTQMRNLAVKGALATAQVEVAVTADQLQEFVWTELDVNGQRIHETIAATNRTTIILTVIAVLLGMILAVLVTRGITRPIVKAVQLADSISNGDLESTVEIRSSDEVGQLLSALKRMQDNLKTTIEADRREARRTSRVKQALDRVNSSVMVTNADLEIVYVNQSVESMFRNAQSDIREALPDFDAEKMLGQTLALFNLDLTVGSGESLDSTYSSEIVLGRRTLNLNANPVLDETGERIGTVVEWSDRTQELDIEREVQGLVDAAKAGDLTQRIDMNHKSGFFETLSIGMNDLVAVTDRVVGDTMRVLSALSNGNLNETVDAEYQGAFGKLKTDANATVARLTEVMLKVRGDATAVSAGATEIAQGNASLSTRTESQAASLEETASSMEEINATVKQTADNAQLASRLALSACEQAEHGGSIISEAISAMNEIDTASGKIAEINGVIDDIAFQTNLLALNASVEAARAGELGRGFAVVASEVRNLAGRSATAAKEIKELIKDSGIKVNDGSRLVHESGSSLEKIVSETKKVTSVVADIATASREQAEGLGQINNAINQLDQMTQQNAALVEEAASSSASMGNQASSLQEQVGFFKIAANKPDDADRDGLDRFAA